MTLSENIVKNYITIDEETEDFSITVTPEDIQRERRTGEYEQNSDNYIEIIMALPETCRRIARQK